MYFLNLVTIASAHWNYDGTKVNYPVILSDLDHDTFYTFKK